MVSPRVGSDFLDSELLQPSIQFSSLPVPLVQKKSQILFSRTPPPTPWSQPCSLPFWVKLLIDGAWFILWHSSPTHSWMIKSHCLAWEYLVWHRQVAHTIFALWCPANCWTHNTFLIAIIIIMANTNAMCLTALRTSHAVLYLMYTKTYKIGKILLIITHFSE